MNHRSPFRRGQARGSALVETALGTTLLVTIIAFGIYFAEVGYLSLKVQEAAISALWNGTHGQMHSIPADYEAADRSMERAADDATVRYADFNGLSAVAGPPGITQTFTTGRNLSVRCDQRGPGPDWDGALLTRVVYRDQGPVNCGAEASLDLVNFPTSFLDNDAQGGLYQQPHADARFTNLRVCSTGRPVGGVCTGSFSMLVDDWGLAGGSPISEVLTCQLPLGQVPYEISPPIYAPIPCANLPFYSAVYGTYLPTAIVIPWMADMMPMPILGVPSPINSRYFFMSAPGEEVGFIQIPKLDQLKGSGLFPTTPGSPLGGTTPTYGYAWVRRKPFQGCFLGRDCN
ncbi:TadE/TadG family type IV pilus assembly protein [Pyxidicoccus xibeiensis]|uniref:TadE/TadG family type IV pilus assembly protein n=1 Tax=Pyxidicoccus xibeiensis TaxID=2906759 RepID=UPI0020A81F31|nr:pilus assembly protein [Pyxidicoccus xibeiensis]MCP3136555.1 pilus assembly protein [Pyxidicoccus xibeiensis]